jgi:hypothetical protein
MVFAADKISKVRELRLQSAASTQPHSTPEASFSRQRKLAHYHRCLALLEDLLADSPLVEQLRIELESIAGSPREHPVLAG